MRVRRRRLPRKRRQPLPQFGGSIFGNTWIDRAAQRGAKGLFRLTQKGGRINAYIPCEHDKKTMTTRVRRRRPRVPPRKGRQPLPQFGAGGDAIDWTNFFLGSIGVPKAFQLKRPKHKGGRLTPRQMKTLMMATVPRRLGIFPQQRGAGIFGTLSGANMLLDILQKEKKTTWCGSAQ